MNRITWLRCHKLRWRLQILYSRGWQMQVELLGIPNASSSLTMSQSLHGATALTFLAESKEKGLTLENQILKHSGCSIDSTGIQERAGDTVPTFHNKLLWCPFTAQCSNSQHAPHKAFFHHLITALSCASMGDCISSNSHNNICHSLSCLSSIKILV